MANGLVAFFDSLLDPESEGLINEVAQEALINAGLLRPVFVPPAEGSLEQLDFSKHVESVDVNVFFDEPYIYSMHFEFVILLKPNVTLGFSIVDSNGALIESSSSTSLTVSPYFRSWVVTISGDKPYFLPEAHGVNMLVHGNVIGLKNPPVLWRSANRYYVIENDYQTPQYPATSEAKRYLMDYWGAMLKDTSVNARMNTLLAMMATNPSANFKFDDSVNVKLPPPRVETDYGTQTATDKIKDTDGKVKIRGIDSYKFTYQDKDVYPSDQSSTGWKVRKTGEDITVGEDVSVKDKDEKEPEPEKPTEPSNPSCNESDDMEVDSGQCEGVPYFGSKLEFIFGNATGNKKHIERSLAMELQLNSIGIFDDAKGKKLVLDNLSNAFDDPTSIRETLDNGRVVRTSVLKGPNGELKVESVWDKEKLISVKLGEDVVEEPEDGTVWEYINITQPFYDGTKIPKSFELEADGEKFWVHPNGTKHMVEYITRDATSHGMPINSQTLLTSFHNSVKGAVKEGIKYEEIMNIGNWELIFSKPREDGLLPVIKHAVYMP